MRQANTSVYYPLVSVFGGWHRPSSSKPKGSMTPSPNRFIVTLGASVDWMRPWQWADYGGSNTVILVGLPRGEHKVRIEAVDAEGRPFIARTVTVTVPGSASSAR
jgi:hypothetical protein